MKRAYLLGSPVSQSISPAMHNSAFRAMGMDWQYELLDTSQDGLPQAVAKLREINCVGANVTTPHKIDVIE